MKNVGFLKSPLRPSDIVLRTNCKWGSYVPELQDESHLRCHVLTKLQDSELINYPGKLTLQKVFGVST